MISWCNTNRKEEKENCVIEVEILEKVILYLENDIIKRELERNREREG